MAFSITLGKITVSMLSAFAIVWFRFPLRNLFFWMIFITLMLPVEVRIFPTVEVIANLQMLDSYAGLTLPLMASATATLPCSHQFFMTLPDELVEAARIDGASPMRFFCDIVFPLSKTNLAALFVITFLYRLESVLVAVLDYYRCGSRHHRGRDQRDDHRRRHHGMELSDGGDVVNAYPSGGDCFSDAACLRARPGR